MSYKKYETFYKEKELPVDIDNMEGIDCLCDNPKGCGYSCHSGTPCEIFKPNFRFDFLKTKEGLESANLFDWDYVTVIEKSELESLQEEVQDLKLRLETLEEK